jgi:amino acid transporter
LGGNIGVFELVCTVLAYNGPVVVFLGFIPVAILLGNGIGLPVTILACGVVIACLAVGLTSMARKLPSPGGFYAFISAGLGKIVGLSAGFTAMMCYYVACISAYALGGIAMRALMADVVGGPNLPWWAWAIAMFVIVAVLGYFKISLSAKVLSFFLTCELLFLVVYDVAVLAQGGADGITLDSLQPNEIFSGSVGIAFMFALGLFGGFEATVIFRDEVRNPGKTIPRATYAVVALLAGLYGVTTWVFINSYGAQAVLAAVTEDPTGSATASVKEYVGTFAYDVAALLLFTSCFALVLASHNITARYAFNLSADGVLHHSLSRVHGKHLSPHRASIAMTGATLIGLIVVVAADIDEALLYGRLAGLYAYTFLILLLMVAIAIASYLVRHRAGGESLVPAALTAASSIVVAIVLYLATVNFDLLTGATGGMAVAMLAVIYGIVVVGMVLAWMYRRRRPDVYARIGREEPVAVSD